MATHSSILAWEIPWTEEPGWLQLMPGSPVPSTPESDLMNRSPPGFSVHGILQARILEWVAISYSRGSSQPRDQTPSHLLRLRHWQGPKNTGVSSLSLLQWIFLIHGEVFILRGFPDGSVVKEFTCKGRRRIFHPCPALPSF